MLGVGFWEIVVILAIAAIVLGPEKMVSFAKKSGTFFAKLQRGFEQAKAGFMDADEDGPGRESK